MNMVLEHLNVYRQCNEPRSTISLMFYTKLMIKNHGLESIVKTIKLIEKNIG